MDFIGSFKKKFRVLKAMLNKESGASNKTSRMRCFFEMPIKKQNDEN